MTRHDSLAAYYHGQKIRGDAKRCIISSSLDRRTQEMVHRTCAAGYDLCQSIDIVSLIQGESPAERIADIAEIVSGCPRRGSAGGLVRVSERPGLCAGDGYLMTDTGHGDYAVVDDDRLEAELVRLIGRPIPAWYEVSIGEMAVGLSVVMAGSVGVVTPDSLADASHDEHEED